MIFIMDNRNLNFLLKKIFEFYNERKFIIFVGNYFRDL